MAHIQIPIRHNNEPHKNNIFRRHTKMKSSEYMFDERAQTAATVDHWLRNEKRIKNRAEWKRSNAQNPMNIKSREFRIVKGIFTWTKKSDRTLSAAGWADDNTQHRIGSINLCAHYPTCQFDERVSIVFNLPEFEWAYCPSTWLIWVLQCAPDVIQFLLIIHCWL